MQSEKRLSTRMPRVVVGLLFAVSWAVSPSPGLRAEETGISVADSILVTNGQVLAVSTVTVGDTLPDIGLEPIFWVDAADTNGWTFPAGSVIPSKIPSKTGSRYIKNYAEEGDSLSFNSYPRGAALAEDGPNGKPYLEFLGENSGRGYLFNPVADETTGGVSSNILHGIGTVIAVYNAEKGGGSFALGGGFGKGYTGGGAGTLWNRGTMNGWESSAYKYAVSLFSGKADTRLFWATAYHDGVKTKPTHLGYSGDWEVVSVVCSASGAQASGVGVGDVVYDAGIGAYKNAGGGMRIAELLVYGELLTDAQRLAVEAYLGRKWFNRETPGANGLAVVGRLHPFRNAIANTGVQAEIRVDDGEELRADALIGGRGTDPRLTKTGAGRLTIGTAGEYHGTVHLAGGTLAVAELPASDGLPRAESVYLHLDAGDGTEGHLVTETRDGVDYVTKWTNLATGRRSGGKPFYAGQTDAARQPRLVYDARLGKKVVDFGAYVAGGAYMNFSTSATTYSNSGLPYVGTILCVVDGEGGGCLFGADNDNGGFARGSCGSLGGPGTPTATVWVKGYPARINAVGVNADKECPGTGGFHVLSTQHPGGQCGRLAAYTNADKAGGVKIAEVVVYDRVLTDDEVKRAEAYLMRKWFNRTRPGFDTPYDINKLTVDGPSVIEVPGADQVVRIRSLRLNAKLVKTGPGKLVVDADCNTDESGIASLLEIRGGGFAFAETADVVTDASAPAPNALFHLDAAQAAAVVTAAVGTVTHWREASGVYENVMAKSTGPAGLPAYDPDGLGAGKPAVDFGEERGYSGGSMVCARPLEAVRTLYAVVGNLAHGGLFLGCKYKNDGNLLDDSNLVEFSRHDTTNLLFSSSDNHKMVTWSEIYIDGVRAQRFSTVDDACHLLEIHADGNAYASAIARNPLGHQTGGIKIGEMIAYDRPLTARERAATRNYLMKKWVDADYGEALPDKPAESTEVRFELGDFDTADGGTYAVDGVWTATRLTGDGDFTKYGDGVLAVRDFSSYSGTVTVAEGLLKVTGTPASGIPAYIPRKENILFHADAENGPVVTTNATTGAQTCKIWKSADGSGWSAVTTNKWNTRPWSFSDAQVFPDSLNGRRTIRFRSWNEANALGGMEFVDPSGAVGRLEGIRSVLWVIGSQEGGGALLGGGASSAVDGQYSSFFRGVCNSVDATILHQGNSQAEVRNASWRINGVSKIWSSVRLTGGWDTLSMVYRDTDADSPTSADGFAFMSSLNYREGAGNYYSYTGFQRLAEVIVYDTILTDDERIAAEHYLNRKWGLNGCADEQDAAVNLARLAVAADATVDLGGVVQYFAAVSGAGTVSNGTLTAAAVVADAAADATLDVEGTFALLPGLTVDLRNLSFLDGGVDEIPVLTAEAFEGTDRLSSAVFASSDGTWQPHRVRATLRVRDGMLYVAMRRGGLAVLLR